MNDMQHAHAGDSDAGAPTEPRRTAVITGGAGGIGIEVVRHFTLRGFRTHVFDNAPGTSAALAEQLGSSAESTTAHVVDIIDRAQVDAAVADIVHCDGRIDILVNLAGVFRSATLQNVTDSDLDAVLGSHVKGTLNTMRAIAPSMCRAKYGRIVNTSSIVVRGSFGGTAYSAAKGGIEAMTRSIAIELAPQGITANCVAPGYIDAGMLTKMPADFTNRVSTAVPVGRPGTATEIASCIGFLASPEASYVTGQVLTVCGGATLLG
ncbi:SDR family oxidoreductase [Rhodococcus erythropolis]|uniref:SDR family oxidoreductase n=1 Tax=Rhodococcus erythropolis TaxID=1833 RepID=UPI001F1D3F77|nr:SDR family NAD(P)-dependent oxidoreductase [Rhodococcus erythropolis]UJC81277.1 SDR family oxidoreductase [Rhodococcus erythropolis]